MTTLPLVEARDVSVRYGARTALARTHLALHAGAMTVIVGPNGAGKTTLMRVLTGELTPDTGAVLLDGQDLVRLSPAALAGRRAVLPQATRLSFPFTVHEVIRLGLSGGSRRSGGHRAGQDGARVAALLRRVDLAGFGDRYYQQLSGGEQQRVHLARVLAQLDAPSPGGAARALFLDEPISSLDIRHQLAVLRIARDVAGDGGAVVAILHDLNLAAMFADRLLAVDGGRVVADGPPAAVITADMVARVFGVQPEIGMRGGVPFVLPPLAGAAAGGAGESTPGPPPGYL